MCRKAAALGVPVFPGVNTSIAESREFIAKGARMLTVTSDVELLAAGSHDRLAKARYALQG